MSLEITTSDRRFTIKCKYEKSLIEYFNTIDKRYFDYDKQEWSFPVDKLEAVDKLDLFKLTDNQIFKTILKEEKNIVAFFLNQTFDIDR